MVARLEQAWLLQKQQVLVITAALFFLACIRVWEANQWTQLPGSDLLHNLANHTSDHPSLGGGHSDNLQAWSCKHSETWFHNQTHRWSELEELANACCQLEFPPVLEAAGIPSTICAQQCPVCKP